MIGGVLSGNRRSIWGGRPRGVMGLGCEGAIYASGLRAPCRWEYFNDRRLSQILSLSTNNNTIACIAPCVCKRVMGVWGGVPE